LDVWYYIEKFNHVAITKEQRHPRKERVSSRYLLKEHHDAISKLKNPLKVLFEEIIE